MNLLSKSAKRSSATPPTVKAIPTEEYFGIVKQQLANYERATVRVTGCSMKPFLHPVRDTVEIVSPKDIAIGDVALFDTRCGRYILHRVTRVDATTFDMRGDNTPHGEHSLPRSQLVGIAISASRNGKHISRDSRTWRTYAALAPLHNTWGKVWRRIRPVAAKIYRTIVPRRMEDQNNAET